ncbi:UDP-N-acetylmuramoyl-L-alanyl-D-glutamate--2,6-diaminopimelate ligase [Oceanispirochaeta sp.]|jgi:UDP-N-acetylmuramoyl-L-alanyl-D-glutamate--2,6-diaminopimelate ligase|uniref:UDP-N-acetylmuramoyl-L-alanyl-D-glutamate--2, 6-diaminopimelate ligase n=1 Tax=Oceanispirochaeta sp. TaxID=2035350 RepID=UPI002636BEE8|nr:UDP-N-acetylmuramoyl-L-alanyl-D-glutamate--2,6-diaminopimelate ligase [Oceanispirochaeta sp.]MDA3958528.1 UDP-N-acetylmuramoyl-L-alanyl-D-glutamate--2,6-diaminopimelate ligase [Oceanispirochaeta sp.]
MKTIKIIFKDIKILDSRGEMDQPVSSLEYDSRKVSTGALFFALEGVHTDGHQYIDQVIHQGAAGIVYSNDLDIFVDGITYIKVENTRQALSPASASFYDFPSKELKVIGVTGTDGKSTTVSFIHQLLEMEGMKAGFLSTVNYQTGNLAKPNPFRQSTPEAPHIHKILREMVDNGLEYAVLEATSHGLSHKNSRLADVEFNVAVLTNVSHEHLEFHGTVEQYRLDKANLFKMIADSPLEETFGVINDDDQWTEIYMDAIGEKPVFLYSLKNKNADLWCSDYQSDEEGIALTFHLPNGKKESRLNMPGLFNVENAMAALLVVSEILEEDTLELLDHVPKLVGVEGRMSPISGNMPFSVLVDYAHTPGSYEKILPLVRSDVQGKLIVLFGSAGERDIEKRSEQGEIAEEYADIIILSDEDPRGDDPMDILKDIAEGITSKDLDKTLFLIPNRKEGMKKAIELASKGDMILTLGKGHESSIIYDDGPRPWKEAEVLKSLLIEAGFTVE